MTTGRKAILVLLVVVSCRTVPVPPAIRTAERAIEARDRSMNGIIVDEPKVYDDALLQQMLAAAQARLGTLQLIDQAAIAAKLGAVSGATQNTVSIGVSVLGPPSAGVTTTDNSGTQSTVNSSKTTDDGTKTTNESSTSTTSGVPVHNVTTTLPQMTATAPAAPAATTTMPSTFSVSASDILNEQLQLTTEITNLRLMLDGSFNDRFLINGDKRFVRPRLTIGFPINVVPDKRYRNAVAVVEVEVETEQSADASPGGEPPRITALLPREKTYNVASIMERNTSIGAGVVTQVASFGASFLRGRKNFFIVQDQDTIAVPMQPADYPAGSRAVRFAWQFRPVLGREYVRAGDKQTFVQLAFPTPASKPILGHMKISTYWRRYDRDRSVVRDIVPGSLREYNRRIDIPMFDLTPDLQAFSLESIEDVGNGQVLVKLKGRFLAGTAIRIGPEILQPGSRMTQDYNLIRFVAPVTDLVSRNVFVVNRDGSEAALKLKNPTTDKKKLEIKSIAVTQIDEGMSLVQVKAEPEVKDFPLLVIIGDRVFGYSDAPVHRENGVISFAVSNTLLDAHRELIVRPLLVDSRFVARGEILAPATTVERLEVLERGATVKYLLYGRNLRNVGVVVPSDGKLKKIGKGEDGDTLRILEVAEATAKTLEQVVLQREGERPFIVAVPPPPPDPPKDKKDEKGG
ncbi:MAG TPA: hypothetical protein VE974_25775 [Thermoanaerobaculia bacterium]|nr:hypothetical protein [Thermoanaerobaculia bacterium]